VAIWIAAILIVAAVALFIAAPLTDGPFGTPRSGVNHDLERHEHDHALAVQGLRELEFDRQMGKLDDDDYPRLRKALEDRALHAMSALERLDSASRSVASAWSVERDGVISVKQLCPQCGMHIGAVDNFCSSCGRERSSGVA
jgi:cytochrome c-type biogenesis protein CcmI